MKFLLLSDLHLLWDNPVCRKDLLRETQFKKLEYVLDYAKKNDCTILQAGDFFHRPRSWYLLPQVIEVLQRNINVLRVEKNKVGILTVPGQHDKYMYTDNLSSTNLGIIWGLESILFGVLGQNKDSFWPNGELLIVGRGWGEPLEFKFKVEADCKILIVHAPILMSKLWEEQKNYYYAPEFLKRHKEFDLILCGDIHKKFEFIGEDGRIICNTGPLLRISADLADHHPGFYIYDTEEKKIEWHEVPHAPADEVISREHLEEEKRKEQMLSEFAQEILKDEEVEGNSFFDNLNALVEKEGVSEGVKSIIGRLIEKED